MDVDYVGGALRRLCEGIRNLRVVPEVRSVLIFETECLLQRFDVLVKAEKERDKLLQSRWTLARGFGVVVAERDEVRLELGSAHAGLELLRGDLAGVRVELVSVKRVRDVVVTERDEARKEAAH